MTRRDTPVLIMRMRNSAKSPWEAVHLSYGIPDTQQNIPVHSRRPDQKGLDVYVLRTLKRL